MELSAYIRYTTLFEDQLVESLTRLGPHFGYHFSRDPRWDEVDLIWKPIIYGVDYKVMKRLKAFNNFLTSHLTITEKIPLFRTGVKVMGECFFELHPNTAVAPEIPIFPVQEELGRHGWIVKPSDGYGGKNVEIFWDVQSIRQLKLDPKKPKIVQKYIEKPLLFRTRKFDLRVHVLLMIDRVLYHEDVYARVAPNKYVPTGNSNKIHLTNIMLHGEDGNLFLLSDLAGIGVTIELIDGFLRRLKPLFEEAQRVEKVTRAEQKVQFDTFELLGIDLIFDQTLRPWLLEVNKDPGFKSEGFYKELGPRLIDDTLKEALFFKWNPDMRTPTGFHDF